MIIIFLYCLFYYCDFMDLNLYLMFTYSTISCKYANKISIVLCIVLFEDSFAFHGLSSPVR